jgi:hypothetical protein
MLFGSPPELAQSFASVSSAFGAISNGAARCDLPAAAGEPMHCQVAPGGYPPGAPTDPIVRDYRNGLFRLRVHCKTNGS